MIFPEYPVLYWEDRVWEKSFCDDDTKHKHQQLHASGITIFHNYSESHWSCAIFTMAYGSSNDAHLLLFQN